MELDFKKAPPLYDNQTVRRYKNTKVFLSQFTINGNVLDIGGANWIGNKLAEDFGLEYHTTNCDLDYGFDATDKYDNIFCFEVLEHLFNPLFCLENIKKHLKPDGKIFISIPKRHPHLLWGKNHFHEFDRDRFRYMLEQAKLKVIKQKTCLQRYDWIFYFTGIRPILRLLFFKPKNHIYFIQL